jgi:hypothetical protein
MADPQPKVYIKKKIQFNNLFSILLIYLKKKIIFFTLNTAFSIVFPSADTYIYNFITSPQAGAPTRPVPTFLLFLSNEPTFLGFS